MYTHACNTSFGGLFDRSWLSASFNYVGIPARRSITFKELFAITVAVTIWSMFLQSRNIIFHCNNQSVVHILNSGTSRCHHIMSLIHCLFYVCCKFNIVIAAVHIPRLKNSPAVALSQLQVGQFQELVLYVAALFTPVPFLDLASFKYCLKDHSLFPSGSNIHYSSHLQLRTTPILMFCDTHNLTTLPGNENTMLLFITDLAKILVVAHQINRINW